MLNKPGSVRVSPEYFLSVYPSARPLFDFFKGKIYVERLEMSSNNMDDKKVIYDLTLEAVGNREYGATISDTKEGYTYFGGYSNSREVRPFENWQRGNDMIDGKLGMDVINKFIKEIIDDLFINAPSDKELRSWEKVLEGGGFLAGGPVIGADCSGKKE